MSDQTQRIAEIENEHAVRVLTIGHAKANHELYAALAASGARCRSLEGVEQSLELAEAAQFAAELRAAGAEARCRALQAQIDQQEAQK
jgi:hypothetical protein